MRILVTLALVVGSALWLAGSAVRVVVTYLGIPAAVAIGIVAAIGGYALWKRRLSAMVNGLGKICPAREAWEAGNFEKAEALLLQGLAETVKSANKASTGRLHWELVDLYEELERFDEAVEQVRSAIAVTKGDGSPYGRQIQSCGPSRLLNLYGRLEQWPEYEELAHELIACSDITTAVMLRLDLANALLLQGKNCEAVQQAQAADHSIGEQEDASMEARMSVLWALAGVTWKAHESELSRLASERLLAKAEALPDDNPNKPMWELQALRANTQAHIIAGHAEKALTYANRAMPKAESTGDAGVHAQALYNLAQALQLADERAAAVVSARQALELWESAKDDQADRARTLLSELEA